MGLIDIIKKFNTKLKPKTEQEIVKYLEVKREQNLIKVAKLKHLISSNTGWKEVRDIIQSYIEDCQLQKLNTPLDSADEKTIQWLKYLDRDIYVLNWVLKIPQQFIDKIDKKSEEEKNV